MTEIIHRPEYCKIIKRDISVERSARGVITWTNCEYQSGKNCRFEGDIKGYPALCVLKRSELESNICKIS